MESKRRILVKSLTWQASGFVAMACISYAVSGSWTAGLSIALAGMVSGFVCYFLHELMWDRVSWGRLVQTPHCSRDVSHPR